MAHADYLTITFVERDGEEVAVVSGELDLGSVADLEEACRLPFGYQKLILDLSGVEFIDVVGLHKLLDLRSGEPRISLVSPSNSVRRIVSLAGVSDAISVEEKPGELSPA